LYHPGGITIEGVSSALEERGVYSWSTQAARDALPFYGNYRPLENNLENADWRK
jgi:hypothetical protein